MKKLELATAIMASYLITLFCFTFFWRYSLFAGIHGQSSIFGPSSSGSFVGSEGVFSVAVVAILPILIWFQYWSLFKESSRGAKLLGICKATLLVWSLNGIGFVLAAIIYPWPEGAPSGEALPGVANDQIGTGLAGLLICATLYFFILIIIMSITLFACFRALRKASRVVIDESALRK